MKPSGSFRILCEVNPNLARCAQKRKNKFWHLPSGERQRVQPGVATELHPARLSGDGAGLPGVGDRRLRDPQHREGSSFLAVPNHSPGTTQCHKGIPVFLIQWWIQVLRDGREVRQPKRCGYQPIIWSLLFKNCIKIKEFRPGREFLIPSRKRYFKLIRFCQISQMWKNQKQDTY